MIEHMLKDQQASKTERQNPWKKKLPRAFRHSNPIFSGEVLAV